MKHLIITKTLSVSIFALGLMMSPLVLRHKRWTLQQKSSRHTKSVEAARNGIRKMSSCKEHHQGVLKGQRNGIRKCRSREEHHQERVERNGIKMSKQNISSEKTERHSGKCRSCERTSSGANSGFKEKRQDHKTDIQNKILEKKQNLGQQGAII